MNRNDLLGKVASNIPSNVPDAVSAEDIRTSILDTINSSIFPEDIEQGLGSNTLKTVSQKVITDELSNVDDRFEAVETKLNTISDGAEANVQSDWNEVDSTSDAFIKNKPVIPDVSELATVDYVDSEISTIETKLDTIASGAEVNVQSDWNETDNTSDAFILNKPAIPSIDGFATVEYVDGELDLKADSSNVYTKAESDAINTSIEDEIATLETKLNGIAEGAEVNVQSDWNVTDNTSDAFILNKPVIPSIDGLVTEEQLNTGLATKANSADVYTKAQSDAALVLKSDKSIVDGLEVRLSDVESELTALEGSVVNSVTAEDNSIQINGTSAAPTLKVKLDKSATTGNVVFEVTEEGLKANVNISQFQFRIVDDLPETGDSLYYYLVKTETENLYDEYVWAEVSADTFRFIYLGDTSVDLEDYATNEELTAALALKVDTTAVYTKSEVDSALALKADLANVYTKSEVDSALTAKLNISDAYTAAQIDATFATLVEVDEIDSKVEANKTKLDGIEAGAEANVQSDWNEADNTSDAFILNKPTDLVTESELTSSLALKQDTLVSGTNIKTINGESLLGNTDIEILGLKKGEVVGTVSIII